MLKQAMQARSSSGMALLFL